MSCRDTGMDVSTEGRPIKSMKLHSAMECGADQ